MPVLTFSGDFVAAQFSIDDNEDGVTEFEVGQTPFLPTDIVRIEIDDDSVLPSGEFDPDHVIFLSFSVERGGVEYEFGVDSGSKIKESGGGSNSEQGDTYFLTNDSVAPPSNGPFAGLDEQTYLFSSEQRFAGGPGDYTLVQTSDDAGGSGNANFNTQSAVLCFARGTLIETLEGPCCIEHIAAGTLIRTVDHGYQPVQFLRSSQHLWCEAPNKAKPVQIAPGALGAGIPRRTLVVSPQHRILIPCDAAPGVQLVPAKALCSLPRIRRMQGARKMDYFHLMFDRHEIIWAEGVPTESFYPGKVALRSLPVTDHAAVARVMGRAKRCDRSQSVSHARPVAQARAVQKRLSANHLPWTRSALDRLTAVAEASAASGAKRSA